MKKLILLGSCLLLLFPSALPGRRVRKGDPVKVDFDPALEGGVPTISVKPIEGKGDFKGEISIQFYVWEDREIVLKTETIPPEREFKMELPTRGKREILGVKVEAVEKGTNEKTPLGEWRAMYFPEGRSRDYKGSNALRIPEDFEEYWNEAYEKLSLVPMDPQIEAVPERDTETGRLFKVTLNSFWNLPIVCWYYVPKEIDPRNKETVRKKYPAIQIMPGWGAEEPPSDRTAEGYITLSVNPKSHGPSKDYFKTPIAHHLWNIDIPGDYYYRAAFMDCRRGIDFLFSRPEVDKGRIGVQGGSQGGTFSLAMGSLDKRVACIAANVPYLVSFPDFSALSTLGSGPIFMERTRHPGSGERVRETLGYIDIAHHAPRIGIPTLVCVGRQDPVCPPLCGVVAVNLIRDDVPKRLFIDGDAEHENSAVMMKEHEKWFEKYLKPSPD